jgi:hypothetical protein
MSLDGAAVALKQQLFLSVHLCYMGNTHQVDEYTLYYITSYYIILYYIISYYIILYYITLSYVLLCYITLHYIIL